MLEPRRQPPRVAMSLSECSLMCPSLNGFSPKSVFFIFAALSVELQIQKNASAFISMFT
jgi:hypothetical protein